VPAAFTSPRPLPDRRVPVVAGGLLVALALPVFLAAGWELGGWAFGAGLWVAGRALGVVLDRVGIGNPNLRESGLVAFGMMGRGIGLMLVAIVVAAAVDQTLGIAGALVYAAAYGVELALSLTLYFQGEARRP
jgi:hypothetical protein